jgi:ABC-type antimicrobial peptide transport system permease subunit
MLLARGVARQREISIRLALGASRGRVIRQLLTESILLSLLGGTGGMLLSVCAARVLWFSLSGIFQGFHVSLIELDLSPDVHMQAYGLARCLLTGALFGLAPALQSTPELDSSMKRRSPSGTSLGRSKLRGVWLGTQVTVSVLLLVVSFAIASGLVSSRASDLGFETRDTYTLLVDGGRDKPPILRERRMTFALAAIGLPSL